MISIEIGPGTTQYFMSMVPSMPLITLSATVKGPFTGTKPVFNWTFALAYADFIAVKGSRRRNVRAKVHPAMMPRTGNPVVVPLTTIMCGVLTVAVTAEIGGKTITATRKDILIGGTNPSEAALKAEVKKPLLRRMIRQESGAMQFNDKRAGYEASAINPYWSGDNLRGVGLGQLTVPPPTDDDIWNWRSNAEHLIKRFNEKRTAAGKLSTRIAASVRFKAEVTALNAWRAAEGLPPITVILPPLTSDQQDLEALRGYNGFGLQIANQYLPHIHEFEPVTMRLVSARRKDAAGLLLKSPVVPDVSAVGTARWVQISGAERVLRSGGSAPGDPHYVANVLAKPD